MRVTRDASEAPDAPAMVPGWWGVVGPRLEAESRAFEPRGDTWVAALPGGDGVVAVHEGGATFEDARTGAWQFDARTVAWGREGLRVPFDGGPPRPGACGSSVGMDGRCLPRVERADGDVVEWWEPLPEGLEQGWTFAVPPDGDGALVVEVALDADDVQVDADGLSFVDAEGTAWQAGAVDAWDASGVHLPVSVEVVGDRVVFRVEDDGAAYPVTLDPIYNTYAWANFGGKPQFGFSLSTAGDVNNDGFDDLLVGSPFGMGYRGRAYVFHGSASGVATPHTRMLTGALGGDAFGSAVAGGGDLNRDGFDDVVIAARGVDGRRGRVYVYAGSASGIGANPSVTWDGEGVGDSFGWALAVGDLNNDAAADVLVGAPDHNGRLGKVYFFRGAAGAFATGSTANAIGASPAGEYGSSLAVLNPPRTDGYRDMLVGAPASGSGNGMAYHYRTSTVGSPFSGPNIYIGNPGDRLGQNLAAAGDCNGDGRADALFDSHVGAGAVTVKLGDATGGIDGPETMLLGKGLGAIGFASSLASADVNGDGFDDVLIGSDADNTTSPGRVFLHTCSAAGPASTVLRTIVGATNGDRFGAGLANAGDLNGDGRDDVAIGAPARNTSTGITYVFNGKNPEGLQGPEDAKLNGIGSSNFFNSTLAPAGDVNSDGFDDLVLGASGATGNTGRAYLYTGSATGPAVNATLTLDGPTLGSRFGDSVSGAGDVDNDGFDDVVIGAYGHSSNKGAVYLYRGSAAGLITTPATAIFGQPDEYFGDEVRRAGDINGDGHADVVIGGFQNQRAWVAYGSPSGLSSSLASVSPAVASVTFGDVVAGAGDLNGDGFDDLAVGAPGTGIEAGFVYFYHGSAAGLSPTAAFTVWALNPMTRFGVSLGGGGDLDGDGFDDFVIGEPDFNGSRGAFHVYLGSSAGIVTPPAQSFNGLNAGDLVGRGVAIAGDVNADGKDDVVVGASGFQSSTGAIYQYSGAVGGVDPIAAVSFAGPALGGQFGREVAGAGDTNGDGYDDVIINQWAHDTVYVHLASPIDLDKDGFHSVKDCLDTDAAVNPGAQERCDGADLDEDCDGKTDDADTSAVGQTQAYADNDGDSFGALGVGATACDHPGGWVATTGDCDDAKAGVHPGAVEVAYDGIDQDCDGFDVCDVDGDGRDASGGTCGGTDCDDAKASVYPGATEVCDGVDSDCDNLIDDNAIDMIPTFVDADGDTWGMGAASSTCGVPPGRANRPGDCDDARNGVNPGVPELPYDGLDNDCSPATRDDDLDGDGFVLAADCDDRSAQTQGPRSWFNDVDVDGWGAGPAVVACVPPAGHRPVGGDCDDGRSDVHPGAPETPGDGIDQDCDGADVCDVDKDGDPAPACGGTDCDDLDAAINLLGVEVPYDAVDQDCDGADLCDVDEDGHDAEIADCGGGDCDDDAPDVHPGAAEIPYDEVDQDCDGTDLCDGDSDGHLAVGCGGDDCDDVDDKIHAGALDLPYDGVDQDCDGADLCDVDDDGADDLLCGGDDCDDGAPGVHPGAQEIPGDEVDQDCDGADLCDVDGDGEPAPTCGGDDCDDQDASVAPDVEEVPYDGVDQDCDGHDQTIEISGGGGAACGCAQGSGPASVGAALLTWLLARRRRSVRLRTTRLLHPAQLTEGAIVKIS